jgi:hypothetical protein
MYTSGANVVGQHAGIGTLHVPHVRCTAHKPIYISTLDAPMVRVPAGRLQQPLAEWN